MCPCRERRWRWNRGRRGCGLKGNGFCTQLNASRYISVLISENASDAMDVMELEYISCGGCVGGLDCVPCGRAEF